MTGTSNIIDNTTAVNISTNVVITGSLTAIVKSFSIDHPTKDNKKLVYGSLESPYHGIRLTGRNKTNRKGVKIELPDYIHKLVRKENVNIQLTAIGSPTVFYVSDIDIDNNCFYVKSNSIKSKEFFWDFTATRNDVPELITEV